MNWHRLRWAIVIVFAAMWIIKEVIVPASAAVFLSEKYMALVVECDEAMEASWYFRQIEDFPAETEVVQMLACHDYDQTRKAMLMAGLPEEYLSWLGLKSLEIYQRPADEFARQHRFTER
jgi:His-Xaa-Ser system protein (TIGR03982 family)